MNCVQFQIQSVGVFFNDCQLFVEIVGIISSDQRVVVIFVVML